MTKFQDAFSEEVWASTYKDHKDETIDDTLKRVAIFAASAEKEDLREEWTQKFYDMLSDFKVTVGGRIYANAGTDWKGTTMINCFVGPYPKNDIDSLDGIFKILHQQAQTLKSEGGWGLDFSWIRPRGTLIEGIGVDTPGAVKFMELFDKSSEIVTSGSGLAASSNRTKGKIRKGAMMGVLSCWHPDVIEFITAKQQPGRLTKFNVSVNCTDDFMQKVMLIEEMKKQKASKKEIKEITWDLEYPDTSHPRYRSEWFGDLAGWKKKYPVKAYRTVEVEWLWNLIMESTYNRAEPGVLFLDRANQLNPLNYSETIYATNPCLSGDTEVVTDKGVLKLNDLVKRFDVGEEFLVKSWNGVDQEMVPISMALKTKENAEIIEIQLDNGLRLKGTPDHKVLTDRGYVEIQNLTEDDEIMVESHEQDNFRREMNG